MSPLTERAVSMTCVPVSTTGPVASIDETRRASRDRLVGMLVHLYGWTLGQDGNLYSPNPSETAWGERVA